MLCLRRLALVSLLSLGVLLLAVFLRLLGHPRPLWAAGPHYVATNGVDSSNCSVSNPCRTIQQAITNAENGDEIRVAAGLYTGTVTLNRNLTLRGGFTTTNWVTPDPDQNLTIIVAPSPGRVIEVSSGVAATVRGFRLTGGNATRGAGVYNEGTLTLEDSQIYGNEATAYGGGVVNYTSAATLILRGNKIYSNTAATDGGGIYVYSGTVTLEANQIFSNSVPGTRTGGGINVFDGEVAVKSCLIYSNTAGYGGGILVNDGIVNLENNTFYDNYAVNQGGGIYAWSGTTAVTNSLIISNTAVISGGGIYSNTSGLSVAFTDFFGNAPNHIEDVNGAIDPTTLDSSNRITNPLFVDPQNFDLHLDTGSPAIDSGAITTTVTIDYEGEGRPFGAGMDRGADEYTDLTSPCYARLDYGQVYTDVQTAVDAASAGSLVQVAGYCAGTVSITKSLTLRGGYTVTDWINLSYGPTILDAQGLGRVIYVTSTTGITPLIENLHVTNGSANYGAGVYLGSNVTATLQNNVIYNNVASLGGGGVYNYGSGTALLQHNTIYSNTASLGGGVRVNDGVMNLRNTLVVSNQGSGIYVAGGSYALVYNDFYGNTPDNYDGAVITGTTDISVPPGFEDPAGGDFHLTLTSAVINAADPASSLAADFEGDSRPQGTRSDIGADESPWYAEVDLSDAPDNPRIITDTEAVKGTPITFTHAITNIGYTSALTDTFVITWTNSDSWDVTLVGISSPVVLTTGASLTFDVVVSVPLTATDPINNQTTITATSETNTAAFDTALDSIVAPGVELAPSYTENADPGEVITYTHTLTNVGPTDVFTISWDSPLGWVELVTPTGPITLANLETELIFVQVRVTDTAPANLADVVHVWANSLGYPGVSAVVTDTTIANPTTGPRYVATSGQDTNNNCKVSGSPCATIGYAVNQAAWGDPVLVAQGTYNEAGIYINQNLELLGGYSGGFGSRDVDPTNTIINAQNSGRALRIQVPAGFNPLIEGFTIQNGATSGVGGAVYVQASSAPTLTQLIILASSATRGGGIYVDAGDPVLQYVTISGTVASAQGGGIYINSGGPLIQDVVISDTTATLGGAIYNENGAPTVQRSRVSNAVASEHGGGFYNSSGSLTLWNNFIYSNTTTTGGGGGIYNSGTLDLINDTLYGNQAATFGGGVFDYNSSSLVISNTIIAASTAITGGGIYRDSSGSLSIDYNNVWNNTATSFPGSNVPTGTHSISADPLFVNVAAGDFHISADSPSLDTADPNTFLTLDIDGDLRPVNQGFDMGADEVGGCLARVVNPLTEQQLGPLYGVVQDAVDAAPEDYDVQISGICRGAQSRLVNGQEISQTVFISKSLELAGGYDSSFNYTGETTTLDAQGLGRVVVITGSVFVDISDLTLTGGDATGLGGGPGGGHAGGGVYNYNNLLTLQGSVITGNQATYGGGLYNVTGTLTLGGDDETKRTYVMSNTAIYGGGAYLTGGSPTIAYATFEQNWATQRGGGLYNAGSSPTISRTLLYSNTADLGGGVYNASGLLSGQVITVAYNTVTADGGGFYNDSSGQLSLQRSIVLSNTASTSGGGLRNTGALTMVNTIVADNTVTGGSGGGLYNQSANLTVRHDTFYANSASGQGGGIYHNSSSSSPVINSTLIVSNTAGSGGTGIHSAGTNPAFDYNDVYGNTSSGVSGTGNISADPSFISTDPASSDFLRIPGGSPAEDAGDPNSPIASDIDEDPRPSNQGFDIGADEVSGCYVRINGNPPTYGSIQVAVGQSTDGDEIRVAGTCQGVNAFVDSGQTVSQTVFLTKTLTIQGGYTTTNWITAYPITYPTTLDALALGRVVYITDSAVITISGLHLRQGSAADGGAVFVGDGVLNMTGNWVYSNTATTNGGAVYNASGQLTLDSNDLRGNQATNGGAFYHDGGTSLLQNNIIRNNTATDGGGIYNTATTTLTVRHNTIYANQATNGGGFYTVNGSPTLVNNIFLDNTATTAGRAIYGPGSFNPDYNDVYPATSAYGGGVSAGSNSLSVDPLLTGDFHLQGNSPVIDKGDPAMTLFHDFEGDVRPSDQGFDMGADEIYGCWARIVRTGVIYGNIQRAVDNSQPGDEIQVTVGECRGVHPYDDGGQIISQTVHVTHALTLHGGFSRDFSSGGDSGPDIHPDPNATTINPMGLGRAILVTNSVAITVERFILISGDATDLGGGPGGNDAGGAFYYNGSYGLLEHVDFYSSTAAYGGAFFNAGDNLIMRNSWINYNVATTDGGAIYNATGAMTITLIAGEATRVYSNTAGSRGGGIFNDSGQVWLLDNNLDNASGRIDLNRAAQGGAVYNSSGQMYLTNNDIFDNAAQDGGAIYNNTGTVTLESNEIYDNAVTNSGNGLGGGFYNSGTATLDLGNKLYRNTSDQDGGAIYNTGVLTAWNTLIYTNTTVSEGGGIYDAGSSSSILHNTFYQNDTTALGGGIYIAAGSSPTIKNNVFDSNTASSGSAVYGNSGTLGYNDYWPGNAASQVAGGVSAGSNNLNADPEFEDPTPTEWDFHLQSTSSLIDVGDDLGVPHDFEDDPRPVNAAPDIGADEYNACLAQVVSSGEIYGRIQTALANSISGDTIRVAAGVCEESLTLDMDITIEGSWSKDFQSFLGETDPLIITTTIEATNGRVITATGPNSIDLSWVKLTDGNTTGNGGGIWSSANDLSLSYARVMFSTAANGGGIYLDSGTASFDIVSVYNNTASSNGGGMYVASGATANLMDSSISYNDATGGDGGGMYIANGGDVDDSGGSIYWNTAGSDGGGVYNDNAEYTVRNKWIYDNTATGGSGGGIYVTGGSSVLELINVLFDDNTADDDGGGLYRNSSGSAALYHNTIHQNEAQTGQGGGVYNIGSSMVISASIIADNTSSSGGSGVHGDTNVNVAYTLRWNNSYTGVTQGAGNINDEDPQFLFSDGSFLSYSSPAIDAVPTSASHIDYDAQNDGRPQICAKDMGLDEYAVGARAMSWVDNGPFPQGSATLTPTGSFTYTFPLRNDSENWLRLSDSDSTLGPGTGYTETITVTLSSSQGDWAEIVGIVGGANSDIQPDGQVATFDIGPGEVVSIEVKVTVPAGAYATDPDDDSTKDFTSLTYQARQCPGDAPMEGASYAAETWVEEYRDFVIAPDNFGTALPGQTVTYTHIITNIGNITDTYLIYPSFGFYASGEIVQPPSSQIELGPLQTETVVISVTIDPAAAGGLIDISSAVARSNEDPSLEKAAANNTVISYTIGTRYVSLDGTDSLGNPDAPDLKDNNCTQRDTGACRTTQQAIDQAAHSDLIKIEQGTYSVVYTDVLTITYKSQIITQTAFVNKSVTLQGGYDKDDWDEDPPNHISQTTTLDPQGEGRAIYVTEGVTPTVDRLTIVNGSAAGLGGGPNGEDAGGNIYNEGGNLTLNANRIYSSTADIGGGFYHGGGDLLLQNNLLHGGQVISRGGAIYIYTGTATLQNNTFYNNSAAQEGGAVYVDGGSFIVTNTIFVTNTATITGGAIYVSSAIASLDYNLYDGNTPDDYYPAPLPGTHNVLDDPQFMAPGDDPPDLHLQSVSPARDKGDPDTDTISMIPLDYDNSLRRLGPEVDIGAYEYVVLPGVEFIEDTYTITNAGTIFVITHTLRNTGGITDTFSITYTSSQGWADLGVTFPYTIELASGEIAIVPVTITVGTAGLTDVTIITATSDVISTTFDYVVDTTVARAPAWQISKVVTPAVTVQPGGYLTYTLTITNNGTLTTTTPYTVTDQLPTHTNFVTATPPPSSTTPTVIWISSDPVGIGEAITRTFVVTVSRPLTDGTPIVNHTYSITGGGAYTGTVGLPVTVTVEAPASLSITKTASADPVQPGDWLTYTITITNADSALGPALNVLISDTLPANVVYQSMGFVAPATGTFTDTSDPLLSWQLANPILVGDSAQVTAAVRVTSPLASSVLTNTYGVTATTSAAYVSGTVATLVTSTNSITLSKAVEPATVTPGEMVTYTITLTNSGDGVATVALTDVLDSAFSPSTYITNVIVPGRTWDTTEGVATVAFTATVPTTVGTYYNQWITATYDLIQATISQTAPLMVRTCWARLNDDPTDYTTVQAAVDASTQPTDVVKVAGYCAGVETRAGVTQTVYVSKTLTIRGGYTSAFTDPPDPDANPTTLDALGGGRVIYITGSISPTIEGLRITGGVAGGDAGGGVYVINATATISNNLVFSNTADSGGGLYLELSDATLSANTVTSNTADYGGGLYLNSSAATLSANDVISNTANSNGGGLYLEGSDATLSANDVFSNTANSNGGGLYLNSSAAALSANDVFSNTANSNGGGLYLNSSAATLSANDIISNTASSNGGGLYLNDSDAMLDGNTVISNTASSNGGGLYLFWGTPVLTNTVVADNQASTEGSGLYIRASLPHLLHTTVARNSGSSGVYVTEYTDEDSTYSTVWLTNTILVGHTVGIYATGGNTATLESTLWGSGAWANGADTGGAGTIVTGTNNYIGAPAFVDPDAGNYHIGPGSAAIDIGIDAGVTVDIDGQSRPVGTYPDLGADEFPAALSVTKEMDQIVVSGSDVTFTISLTNTGIVTLTGVTVTDTLAPNCAKDDIGNLAPTGIASYTCVVTGVTVSFTNTATVTGASLAGTVTATDTASVSVISPTIEIAKMPDSQTVQSGDTVTFTISITNTGDALLSPITVTDELVPGCDWTGSLTAGVGVSYTCALTNVMTAFTNTVVVTGTPPVGAVVTDTDTASVNVISPTIEIAKTPYSQTMQSGDPVTFTISVTNTGDVTLSPITVTDELAPDCDWTGSLTAGDSVSYTCVVTDVTADFTNVAVVTGTPPVGAVVTDTDTAFVNAIGPDIEIVKSPDSQMVRSGDTVTFTISVTNTGDVILSPITVTDELAPDCGWIGSLAAGNGVSYTCVVTDVTADFTNTAVVTGTPPVGEVVTASDTASVNVISPTIEIAKMPDSQTVQSGDAVTFTISVTNTGDASLSPITVTDELAPDCGWIGSLTAGNYWTYTCVVTDVTTAFTNTAVVTGTPPVGAVVTDTDAAFVDVITPTIEIAKTPDSQVVQSGDTVTFTISVTNTGDALLSPITVTDELAPDCDWTGSLAAGNYWTHTCVVTDVTSDFTNMAVVTGAPPVGEVVTDSDTAFVDAITPTIAIAKTPDSQTVQSGDTVTFTISITNTGDALLLPITVTDELAPNCEWTGGLAAGNNWSYACVVTDVTADFTNTVVVTGTPPVGAVVTDTDTAFVDAIGPGIKVAKTPDSQMVVSGNTVTFTITVSNTGDVELTDVTVTDAQAPNCASDIGNLGVGITTTYACTRTNVTVDFTNSAMVTGTPPAGPDVTDIDGAFVDVISPTVEIVKTPDNQTVQGGDTVTFTISVTNTGDVILSPITVTDELAPDCGWIGSLAAGNDWTYTCVVTDVTTAFTNTAVVTGTPPVDAVVTASDTASVNVISPTIEIVKSPDSQMAQSGDTITFTISVTNTGDVTLSPITVTDEVVPGCEWTGSLTAGSGTSYTCVVTDVTAAFTNTAVVTGTPSVGEVVTASDTAFVDIISPTIEIAKTPDSQMVRSGGTLTFTISVTNTGNVVLSPITVTDELAPDCEWTGSLAAGNYWTYACVVTDVTTAFTNTAVVTGTPPVGAVVTDTDMASVTVISPSIEIAKTPDSQTVQSGDAVTFTISVTNTGDALLLPITVTDELAPDCEWTGSLAAGNYWTYACVVTDVTAAFTNTALVTGIPPVGAVVTDTDTAFVDVINPAIEIAKTPDTQTVVSGSEATFTISITNTGDVTLSPITVTDILATGCERTLVSLADGANESYTCTVLGVIADFTNTVVVTGVPSVGEVVTDSDTATVIAEEAIAGLVATNDSPTLLSSATTLTATITAGTNVVYTWSFGYGGATGSGAVVTHTYPAVGVYTAIVTASNSVSVLTATTTVTITDVPITGLVATNDSPTSLGRSTTLSVTITAGTNVTYTWSFGYGGATGSGAVVMHTYPATGTYTAIVTASNSVSLITATTIVSITAPAGGDIYLPIILRNYTPPPPPTGPDLVVTDISVVPDPPGAGESATVCVTVRNQGNQAVTYGNNFYVDFYVDRVPALFLVGDIEWGVQGSWFGVGESRTLCDSYTFTSGSHQLYAQADTGDTVVETNEGNNVRGPESLNVASLGGGEAPVVPAVISTPGVGRPRSTPTPEP